MKVINSMRQITTIKVDLTIINICNSLKIDLRSLLRNSFQLLYAIDSYYDEINYTISQIIEEHKHDKNIPLSYEYKIIKTHRTRAQNLAYEKIDHKNRIIFLNELMSIAINNSYSHRRKLYSPKSIESDSLMNILSVDLFTCPFIDTDLKLVVIESTLSKINHMIQNKYLAEGFYDHIYSEFFNDIEIIKNFEVAKFLSRELEKLYFAMLKLYAVPINSKSSQGLARKVIKKYSREFNGDIASFINNKISIYKNVTFIEQTRFLSFLKELHKSEKETYLIDLLITNYKINSKYYLASLINYQQDVNLKY